MAYYYYYGGAKKCPNFNWRELGSARFRVLFSWRTIISQNRTTLILQRPQWK